MGGGGGELGVIVDCGSKGLKEILPTYKICHSPKPPSHVQNGGEGAIG